MYGVRILGAEQVHIFVYTGRWTFTYVCLKINSIPQFKEGKILFNFLNATWEKPSKSVFFILRSMKLKVLK